MTIQDFVALQVPIEVAGSLELKPCPCCGGQPILVKYLEDRFLRVRDKFAVQCKYTGNEQGCGLEGQHSPYPNIAITAWNRRIEI